MTELLPWTECPEIDVVHRYMGRWSDNRGSSGVLPHQKLMQWPSAGYVTSPTWDDGIGHGGLWGYLNCIGDALEPALLGYLDGGTVQVLVVDTRELRFHIDDTCRAPRGWVKFSGAVDDVLVALRSDGTHYAEACANYLELGLSRGKQKMRELQERLIIQASAEAAALREHCAEKIGSLEALQSSLRKPIAGQIEAFQAQEEAKREDALTAPASASEFGRMIGTALKRTRN